MVKNDFAIRSSSSSITTELYHINLGYADYIDKIVCVIP